MNRRNARGRHLRNGYMYIHETSRKRVQGTFLRAETACGRAARTGVGGGRGERVEKKSRNLGKCQRKIPICLEILAAVHGMHLSPLIVLR